MGNGTGVRVAGPACPACLPSVYKSSAPLVYASGKVQVDEGGRQYSPPCGPQCGTRFSISTVAVIPATRCTSSGT